MDSDAAKQEGCNVQKVKAFLLKWHLPMFLVFALLIGYLVPAPGKFLNELDLGGICFGESCVWNSVGSLCVTLIFFMSGSKLKTDEIKNALSAWKAATFGIVSILLITPCVSFAMIVMPLSVPEFSLGLALFFSMPTTLSSGPIITGQAKGNIALALLLTVVTNILGVFTMPLFVTGFLGLYEPETTNVNGTTDVDVTVDAVPIILKLVFIILIPLAVGKSLRYFATVRKLTKKYKVQMKLLSSFLLALVPWMKVSSSAEDFRSISAGAFFSMFALGIAVHMLYLAFNYSSATYVLNLNQPEKRAVVIVTSQKTLPVAVTVLELLPASVVGSPGLVAIPIICAHFVQIVIDAFIASSWATRPLSSNDTDDSTVESAESQDSIGSASAIDKT